MFVHSVTNWLAKMVSKMCVHNFKGKRKPSINGTWPIAAWKNKYGKKVNHVQLIWLTAILTANRDTNYVHMHIHYAQVHSRIALWLYGTQMHACISDCAVWLLRVSEICNKKATTQFVCLSAVKRQSTRRLLREHTINKGTQAKWIVKIF